MEAELKSLLHIGAVLLVIAIILAVIIAIANEIDRNE